MNWLFCCGTRRDVVVEPIHEHQRVITPPRFVIENPHLHRFVYSQQEQHSDGSNSNESKLTTARRQTLLELHKRRMRVRELQDLIAQERIRVDDLLLELAIT